MTREHFTVTFGADYYGRPGYSYDGWVEATKEEAVIEYLVKVQKVDFDEAYDRACAGIYTIVNLP